MRESESKQPLRDKSGDGEKRGSDEEGRGWTKQTNSTKMTKLVVAAICSRNIVGIEE